MNVDLTLYRKIFHLMIFIHVILGHLRFLRLISFTIGCTTSNGSILNGSAVPSYLSKVNVCSSGHIICYVFNTSRSTFQTMFCIAKRKLYSVDTEGKHKHHDELLSFVGFPGNIRTERRTKSP